MTKFNDIFSNIVSIKVDNPTKYEVMHIINVTVHNAKNAGKVLIKSALDKSKPPIVTLHIKKIAIMVII